MIFPCPIKLVCKFRFGSSVTIMAVETEALLPHLFVAVVVADQVPFALDCISSTEKIQYKSNLKKEKASTHQIFQVTHCVGKYLALMANE